jgi:DNA-binding beta-propeller fold protein YncE
MNWLSYYSICKNIFNKLSIVNFYKQNKRRPFYIGQAAVVFLLLSSFLSAQTFLFKGEIGEFQSASSFSITPGGLFYIADKGKNEIIKLDTLNNAIQSIGGYGWSTSTFDEPVDIYATDLRVYVTDKNNNRVQVFDKDLNFLFVIKTDKITNEVDGFRYPVSCATSIQGDIYILDSDNTRVMKFNSSGNFLLEFGNYSSGDFLLESPLKIALSQDSKIFVLDDGFLNVFDQYGMGLIKIGTNFEATNLNITFNNLTINSNDSLYYQNLKKPIQRFKNITPKEIDADESIIDAIIFDGNLYLLTESRILVFAIIN